MQYFTSQTQHLNIKLHTGLQEATHRKSNEIISRQHFQYLHALLNHKYQRKVNIYWRWNINPYCMHRGEVKCIWDQSSPV